MSDETKRKLAAKDYFLIGLCLLFLPVVLVLSLLYWLAHSIYGLWLAWSFHRKYAGQGVNAIFVYSNSPHWKEDIETNILPKISGKAVVLNWSERSTAAWKTKDLDLPVRLFRHSSGVGYYFRTGKKVWTGDEYNPLAILLDPWWRPKVLRFWKPFKDLKHGRGKKLQEMVERLYRKVMPRGLPRSYLAALESAHKADPLSDGDLKSPPKSARAKNARSAAQP